MPPIPSSGSRISHFWYYDTSISGIRKHPHPTTVPVGTIWCPVPLKTGGKRPWVLMLHDHSPQGTGYYYAQHVDVYGDLIRYTQRGVIEKAAQLNLHRGSKKKILPEGIIGKIFNQALTNTRPCVLPTTLLKINGLSEEELVSLVVNMIHDWEKLNEIHNNRAHERGWCGEYENRQALYNAQFKVLKLSSRNRLPGGQLPGL